MAITVDPTNNTYDLAEMRLDGNVILSNENNVDLAEEGGDIKYVTNSEQGTRRTSKKDTAEWGLSGVEPEYYDLLLEYKLSGKLFPIQYYNFGKGGKYNHRLTLTYCKITELTMSHGDDGATIDCSGNALGVERPRQ